MILPHGGRKDGIMFPTITSAQLKKMLIEVLENDFRITPDMASDTQIYKALSLIIVDHLKEKRSKFMIKTNSQGRKQVYYLSMEFLMGRSLKTSLHNLGISEITEEMLSEFGIKLESICENEPDAGLGNGGLGRLAACYLDALATCELPATGYSICYEYGIFKQKIEDGWQTELPDNWLPGGEVWLVPVPDQAIDVRFDGEIVESWDEQYHNVSLHNYNTVTAIPNDMYVSGYNSEGVSKLRLWTAKAQSFDMNLFNKGEYAQALGNNNIAHAISKVLYPNDNHLEGKALRLRQQYFMCAASIGDIVMRHMNVYGTLDNLHEKVAIHINDTHPTLAIPELMRILLDDCGYPWAQAWHICTHTFAYTNHTVMAEALETWDKDLMVQVIPRIYSIIAEINNRYCTALTNRNGGNPYKAQQLTIIRNNKVRMANLCVDASHSVNGVSKLHSEIIKSEVFGGQYEDTPNKFKNVTNGIAYRRWLMQSNPELTKLLSDCIGEDYKKNASELIRFKQFESDRAVLDRLALAKRSNKEAFSKHVFDLTGQSLNLDSIFDVQVKRLHEYKRQHLNALHIIAQYNALLENPNAITVPKTYIFAAKAAPGYFLAKQIIKLIWSISQELRANPKLNEKLSVVFMEDYNVSLSERLMPASEISEQISLAGTEASGTGNMKLMLNGAITLGTFDGANVEIHEQAGNDNIITFGMRKEEVEQLKRSGYKPEGYYNSNPIIKSAIDRLYKGVNGSTFEDVANSLRFDDPYMVLADFDAYAKAQSYASECYADKYKWNKMSLVNIASSGLFSADRAVTEYARDIWGLL